MPEDSSLAHALFGQQNRHLRQIERLTGVRLSSKGAQAHIEGAPEGVEHALIESFLGRDILAHNTVAQAEGFEIKKLAQQNLSLRPVGDAEGLVEMIKSGFIGTIVGRPSAFSTSASV